jgi:arylsulfatase A-like enzyme
MPGEIGRRDFMKAAVAGAAASVFLRRSSPAFAADRPGGADILVVMPDQMRGDCLSILGHPAVQTPQADELARQGVLFRRAYSTVPSCIPARYGMLTGLYPQTSGVVGFAAKPLASPTMPDALNEAGYRTVLVGRNMHQKTTCGYQESILGSTYVSNDDYDKFLKAAAPACGGIRKVIEGLGIDCNHWGAKPWPLADNLHPTEWIVAESRKVVARADAGKPLMLTASFYAPHSPLFPPKKHFDACANRKLPAPAHGDWVDWQALTPQGSDGGHRVLLEGQALHDAQAGYFGLIDHLDAQIAPLIAEFKARSDKAGRPWVIVFTSDHGELLGDNGYYRKCEPYEGSANIPFIVCGSGELGFKAGRRIDQPVCLEDIMPTLLALAGAKCPASVDGVNLLPTLRGQKQQIRPWLHFEHSPCYSKEQGFEALTDGRFKYIWRPAGGNEQLFDLESDPKEEHDLSKLPSHAKELQTWRGRMVERLARRPEGFVAGGSLVPGRPYKAINAGTPGNG